MSDESAAQQAGAHLRAAQQAGAHLRAGEYRASREAALAGLTQEPENVELLVLAGRAGVELDADDATEQLQRATELAPENADAWHYLGEALATEGRMDEAGEAFRQAVELNPADQVALSHLGHTSAATGNQEEAVGYLSQAAQSMGRASTASISLVDMYRTLGQHEQALAQARLISEAEPDDVLTTLDVAELSLELGRADDAFAAFERLHELDDVPGHEVYPLHGLIKAELARECWEHALELAHEASAVDAQGRTAGIVAFLEVQTGAAGADTDDGPDAGEAAREDPPSREEVDAALDASLSEYRRMHADDRRLSSEDILG